MAATADADEDWHGSRLNHTAQVIGRDQHGRAVYSDRCVIIPGTLRPDGTRRKDRRVRAEQLPDGSWKSFVPQDEVEAFETRAHREARKERTIPGLASSIDGPADNAAPKSKSAKKNETRRLKKQQQREEAQQQQQPSKGGPAEGEGTTLGDNREPIPEDLAKRAKNLKKKLRQIADLKANVNAGLDPSSDQCVLGVLQPWSPLRRQDKLSREAVVQAELAQIEARLQAL